MIFPRRLIICLLGCLLAACNLPAPLPDAVPTAASLPTVTGPPPASLPTLTPAPDSPYTDDYQDVRGLFAAACFAFWESQAGQVWVIRTPAELNAFYNAIDEAALCRFRVLRLDFDFTERVLLGAVNVGTGCAATTDPLGLVRDDAARTITLRVAWGVAGDCGYRLARPFWVSMPRPPEGYTMQIGFEPVEERP